MAQKGEKKMFPERKLAMHSAQAPFYDLCYIFLNKLFKWHTRLLIDFLRLSVSAQPFC